MRFNQNESNNLVISNSLKESSNVINGIQFINRHIPKHIQFLLNLSNPYYSQNLEELTRNSQPYDVVIFLRLLMSLIPCFLFIISFYFKRNYNLDTNAKVEALRNLIELQKNTIINKDNEKIAKEENTCECKNCSTCFKSSNELIHRKYLLKTYDPIYRRYQYSIM